MKNGGKGRALSHEDRHLWSTVARTVHPLPGKLVPPAVVKETPAVSASPPPAPPPPLTAEPMRPSGPLSDPLPVTIDRVTRRKLAKGSIGLDGMLDLHDLTQAEAYERLLGFLRIAQAQDRRHILVITGKGSTKGRGVLRDIVPHWLATPPFRSLVSGFDRAARGHGGEGAIYLKIRRKVAR